MAENEDDAFRKAEEYKAKLSCSYETENNDRVSWGCVHFNLSGEFDKEPVDGEEIFSRFLKNGEAESLLTKFDG